MDKNILKLIEEDPENLYEHAPCGYMSTLPDGLIVKVNQTLLKWLGYRRNEILFKKKFQELISVGGRIFYETHHAPLLKMRGFVKELSYDFVSMNGMLIPVLTNSQLVKDDSGAILGFRNAFFNITDRKKYEKELLLAKKNAEQTVQKLQATTEELQATTEELQAASEDLTDKNAELIKLNNDLDNFIYTASHDLKAPIANIEGLMHALEKNLSTETRQQEKIQKLVSMIYQSVDRFKNTILDLTEITKLQKELQEDLGESDVVEIIEHIKLDLHQQITEADAVLEINIVNCSIIHFSKKNLKSIIYNLISNAVKYRSPDRRVHVRISCHTLHDYVLLTVEDNGLGFDNHPNVKIFSMFKRLHNHVEGTGIGLYIVKRMIDNAGGRIEVESAIGKGTIFRVYFKR